MRASWSVAQNPCLSNIGNLVVAIATAMSINRSTEANEVNKPRMSRAPQTISKGSGVLRPGNADLRETACTQSGRKQELLDALREEDPAHEDADEQDTPGDAARGILWRYRHCEPRRDSAE